MREKELYEKIEVGKSYDFWTFAGYANLITIKEDDRYADDGSYDRHVSTTTHDNLQAFFNRTK
jgi:hypothetical protein